MLYNCVRSKLFEWTYSISDVYNKIHLFSLSFFFLPQVSGISTEIFKQIETVENDHDASTAAALEVSKTTP